MVLIFTVVLISTQKLTQNKNHRFFESAWFLVFWKFESLFVKNHGSYKKMSVNSKHAGRVVETEKNQFLSQATKNFGSKQVIESPGI